MSNNGIRIHTSCIGGDSKLVLSSEKDIRINSGDNYTIFLSGIINMTASDYILFPKKSSHPPAIDGVMYYNTERHRVILYTSNDGWRTLNTSAF